jgi:hypothetical protein
VTAQIIFFPFKHSPDEEKLRQLHLCQEQLHFAHAELKFSYRNMAEWQYIAAKMRYHHGFRERWEIITKESKKKILDPVDFPNNPA